MKTKRCTLLIDVQGDLTDADVLAWIKRSLVPVRGCDRQMKPVSIRIREGTMALDESLIDLFIKAASDGVTVSYQFNPYEEPPLTVVVNDSVYKATPDKFNGEYIEPFVAMAICGCIAQYHQEHPDA